MNKLKSILLVAIMAIAALAFTACQSKGEKLANDYVEELNKDLPQEAGGMTIEKVKIDGKSLVFNTVFDGDVQLPIDNMRDNREMTEQYILQGIASAGDDDKAKIIEIAKEGYSVLYVYTSGDQSVEFKITSQQLLDALK